jgi:conflict system pore-forming effector with SLATT domain/uncharacterized protein DUF4231
VAGTGIRESDAQVSGPDAVPTRTPPSSELSAVVASLQITVPAPVLALFGGPVVADESTTTLSHDTRAAVATAVTRTGAVVLDGTELVNDGDEPWEGLLQPRALVRLACRRPVVGVPAPSYGHVVIAKAENGHDDPQLLTDLGQAIAHGMPTALLLAGGDGPALAQTAVALERGFDVFVAAGTGGAADRLATAIQSRRSVDTAAEAVVASGRFAGAGRMRIVQAGPRDVATLSRRLVWALHPDRVLKDAWHLFATFDGAAVRLRASFERFQAAILLIGLLATLLALLDKQLGSGGLRWAVAAASIALAGLTALSGRRAAGKRWIVTRAAAESVKSEIFRYRTGTGRYADGKLPGRDRARRPQVLAARLGDIERRLMHTEVGNSALPRDEGALLSGGDRSADDGLSAMTAEDYVALRIEDQLRYYHARLRAYDRRRKGLQGVAVGASSAGALVAVAGGQMWVALTSVVAAAPLAYLAHLQVEKTIVTYNQSVAQLDDMLRRWHARASRIPTRHALARLVNATEAILTAEQGAWVEEMTEALHELDDAQPGDPPSGDGPH